MNRKKKLIRNICIVVTSLFCMYFFSGYYFSKEKCLEQLMNALYLEDNIVLKEIQDDENIAFVVMDETDKNFSIIRMEKKYNFLYKAGLIEFTNKNENELYSQIRKKINHTYSFDYYETILLYDSECIIMVFYRNNPNIDEIEFTLRNNEKITLNEWNNNYIVYSDANDFIDKNSTIKAYDSNHQLIEEVQYQKFYERYSNEPIIP